MVQTALGMRALDELGRVLTHEHLAMDFLGFYVPPPDNLKRFLDGKIQMKTLGYVKQYPYSNNYNLILNDVDSALAVIEDVKIFKEFGGQTIVDNSNHGLKRDINLMKKISRETGINVIVGTGHYVASTQTSETLNLTREQMYDLIIQEMTIGCLGSEEVRAGFIGEVGSAWPIENFEKKAIQATGEVQAELKCPVSFHPGRNPSAPFEIMRIYSEAGGDPRKAIVSHLDRTLTVVENLLEFADQFDCYCQFDLFGTECSYYQLNPIVDMLSDAQRIELIKSLQRDGKLDRVLMSHDIHTKHRLVGFGGHGYAHIFTNVVPKMLMKGLTQEDVDLLSIENPKRWLSY